MAGQGAQRGEDRDHHRGGSPGAAPGSLCVSERTVLAGQSSAIRQTRRFSRLSSLLRKRLSCSRGWRWGCPTGKRGTANPRGSDAEARHERLVALHGMYTQSRTMYGA